MIGPGKYDDACTVARLSTDASACVLIVLAGNKGSGFSVQANALSSMNFIKKLPSILREMADQIEKDATA